MIPADFIYIDTDVYNAYQYVIDKSVVVQDGVFVSVPDILVTNGGYIENHGTIITDKITVCDGCQLEIINTGTIKSEFVGGSNAKITQVVSDKSHLSKIDAGLNSFDVKIMNISNVNFSDILNLSLNSNGVDVYNSRVVMDVDNPDLSSVRFHENVFLVMNDVERIQQTYVLKNVDGDLQVLVDADVNNSLMAIKTYVAEDDLYVKLVRETDYAKIMNNATGRYLNSLREDMDANNFLSHMDSAQSIEDLYKIMADSVRTAPINLMDGVRMLNMFDMNDFNVNTGVGAFGMFSDDSYSYGAQIGTCFDFMNLDVGVRGYVNSLSGTDGYDEYSGMMMGVGTYAQYDAEIGFVRGLMGANLTMFDISNVFDGDASVDNPIGYSYYAGVDVGHRFDYKDGFYMSTYVGGFVENIEILNQNESDYMGRIGFDVGYEVTVLGIKYNYALRANIESDAGLYIGASARFMSEFDMVGGYADVSCVENEIGRGYKITAGVDFKF